MGFPPRPAALTTDPSGKSGIAGHLVENARRASELARAEADLSIRVQRVIHHMRAACLSRGGHQGEVDQKL